MSNPSSTYRVTEVDYDPFAEPELDRVVPTTEAQREVWLADRLGRESSLAYNESISLRLRGALDVRALRAAVDGLARRHEALRATVGRDGTELFVARSLDVPFESIDLTGEAGEARDRAVARVLAREVEEPFDLATGPLIRARLLVLGADDHQLVLTAHHVACDGWSFGVIARDLGAAYAAVRSGGADLAPAAHAYGEYALSLRAWEESPGHAADERYWLSRFDAGTPTLDLPTDRPRGVRRTFASRRIDVDVDPALVNQLKQVAGRQGASLFGVLLAAFSLQLSRLSGQASVVVGVPVAGQALAEAHDLVGHCVNLLPIRVDVDAGAPASALVGVAQAALLDGFEHGRYTFGTLLRKLQIQRDPARLPLVSVMFNLDQALDGDSLGFEGMQVDLRSNPRHFENFELFVNASQVRGGLRLECQYNTDLFDPATVRAWLGGFVALLQSMADDLQAAVSSLSSIDEAQAAMLQAWNDTVADAPAQRLVHGMFEAQAARTPDAPAVTFGTTTITYGALDARAGRLAAAFAARGAGPGALVGLCVERGPDMIAALLGVLKTGAAYVPLDPGFPRERLVFMAEDASLALLVTGAATRERIAWPAGKILDLDAEAAAVDAMAPYRAARDAIAPSAPAYVIYTSGSTGKPKGVVVPHGAVTNFLASMDRAPGLRAGDRLAAVTTLSFDIAVLELLLPLTVGGEVVLASREQALDGRALASLLESSAATVLQATPATWRLLVEAGWRGSPGFRAFVGGEALPTDLADQLLGRAGEVWNLYGPTETTIWSTAWRVDSTATGIRIGRPIDNTTVWVLDGRGTPMPIGAPGELCIGGAGVADGYLHRPELTADRFVADRFSDRPGARLYRTGDRGRWRSDGQLEHLGRLDFQVKVRGYRIELGEIESALASHPAVAAAVTVTREPRPGDVRLIGYWTGDEGAGADEATLREHLRGQLPEYMIPQHLVRLERFPLLPNGKIDRNALPEPSSGATGRSADASRAPRTETERAVVAAMEEILAVHGLGVDDDFFAMGGHSLLAARLVTRLEAALSVTLPLREVFESSTPSRLAAAVERQRASGASRQRTPIRRRPDAEQHEAPLTTMQERIRVVEAMYPGRVTYNTPSAHRLRGPMDVEALDAAFREIVRRQPALRTVIRPAAEGGKYVQQVLDGPMPGLLPLEDLSALPPEAREARLREHLDALTDEPFDLARGPLYRARLFRLGEQEHVLYLMTHHAVWDGWSFDLFYVEMAALYPAFRDHVAPSLPPLPVTYGDFAQWHGEWLRGPDAARQLDWWARRFAGVRPPVEPPVDKPRGAGMTGRGATEPIAIDPGLTARLREVALRADVTVNMTALAAYATLISAFAATSDVVLGVPVRGRVAEELEPVMGFFNNLLALPLDVDPTRGFASWLPSLKRELIEAFDHQDVPFELVAQRLEAHRERGRGAVLYQALFSFQDVRARPLDWGGLHHERLSVFQRGATEDLGLWLVDDGRHLHGGVTFNADIFEASTARMLRDEYLALLSAIAQRPDVPIGELVRDRKAAIGRARAERATVRGVSDASPVAGSAMPAPVRVAEADSTDSCETVGGALGAILAVWGEVLGIARVRPEDNFFDLGGNSLLAMQAMELLQRRLGRAIEPRRYVFESAAQIARAYDAALEVVPPRPGTAKRILGSLFRRSARSAER